MGLDMYLILRREHDRGEDKPKEVADLIEEIGQRFSITRHFTDYYVAYWRKANAVHWYFVKYCAHGIDECQDIEVSEKNLEDLLTRCNNILNAPDDLKETTAMGNLHTQEGFFFGDTDYDEYYYKEIEYTKKVCESVLKFLDESEDEYSVYYKASW